MAYVHRVERSEPVVHHTHEKSESSFGFLAGIIVLLFFLVVFFFYVLPFIQRGVSTPQITVPEKIDINVNQK